MVKNREYSDISLSFERNPLTGDVKKVENDLSIKQSVKVLLLTHFNERPFQEGKGSKINSLLFDLKTVDAERSLKSEIREVLFNFEPRVNVFDIKVKSNPDDNYLKIEIFFTILNSLEENQVDIALTRIR